MNNKMHDIVEKSKVSMRLYIRYVLSVCIILLFGSFLINIFPNQAGIGVTISLVGAGLSIIFLIKLIRYPGIQMTKGIE